MPTDTTGPQERRARGHAKAGSMTSPGPWRVEADMRVDRNRYGEPVGTEEHLSGWNIYAADGYEIVGCEGILPDEWAEANARLMAAAPVLRDLLMDVLAQCTNDECEQCERIRTALATCGDLSNEP